MNLSNNWHKGSGVRIPLFTALVYAYFCAPVSLEHKAFVQNATSSAPPIALADRPRVIHVFVALADNEHQGIIPVPAALGNGEDPSRNLYWGAAFGVRTFLRKSSDWREVLTARNPFKGILERSVFQHRTQAALLVADAYRGSETKQALTDFFRAAAGIHIHEGQP